jgi:hypothetical protein
MVDRLVYESKKSKVFRRRTTPNYVVSVPQLVTGQVTMTAVQTFCNNPTIWGSGTGNPNVDMAGIYNSTQMNSYNAETVPGNGWQ